MSYRISRKHLPTKLVPVVRVNKHGKVETFSQRYHVNPDKKSATNIKLKPKQSDVAKHYTEKGFEGVEKFVNDLVVEILNQSPELLNTLNKFNSLKTEITSINRLQQKINELLESNKTIISAKPFFEAKRNKETITKKLREKRNKLYKQFEVLKLVEDYLGHREIPKHKVQDAVEKVYKKAPPNIAENIINTYKILKSLSEMGLVNKDFLKDKNEFLKAIETLLYGVGDLVNSKITKLLSDESVKNVIEDLLITNPFNIEDENELLTKMLTNRGVLEHTFNSYIKELFNSSNNEMTNKLGKLLESLEEIENGKPKLDPVVFYRLFNSIAEGMQTFNHTIPESVALFFYLNGNTADGKKLPINYLHHNTTIRQIANKLMNSENVELSPSEEFALLVNSILEDAIKKLPKKENTLLFRGENSNPVTWYAQKGDVIVYPTPVSTSSIEQKDVNISYSVVEDGELKSYTYSTKQGAKVFARGNGAYAKINNAIIKGEKPELFEGQKEFLTELKDRLGELPQGSVINIHADEAYKVPNSYLTIVNRGQEEYLLPPNTMFKVVGKLEGEHYGSKSVEHKSGKSGGMYTLIVETYSPEKEEKLKPKQKS